MITVVRYSLIQVGDDGTKVLLGLLVEVGNGNAGSENSIIGMLCSEICSGFRRKIVEFYGRDAVVDTSDDLFGDPGRVDENLVDYWGESLLDRLYVIWIEAVAELSNAGSDLNEG